MLGEYICERPGVIHSSICLQLFANSRTEILNLLKKESVPFLLGATPGNGMKQKRAICLERRRKFF